MRLVTPGFKKRSKGMNIYSRLYYFLSYDKLHGKILSASVSFFYMLFLCRPFRGFLSIFRLVFQVKPFYSQLSAPRLVNLYQLIQKIRDLKIEGDIVECGVWNGGSAAVLGKALKDCSLDNLKCLWLFDSFEGLPFPSLRDEKVYKKVYYKGLCRGSRKNVEMIFKKVGVCLKRIRIVEGWLEETLPNNSVGKISLLHIDTDWYDSVRIALEYFYHKVVEGGFIVIDDYRTLEGCRNAVNDFLKEKKISAKIDIVKVDWNGVWFRKP